MADAPNARPVGEDVAKHAADARRDEVGLAQERLARRVDALARRIAAMRRPRDAASPSSSGPAAGRAADLPSGPLDELLTAVEELQVAEEELLQQHIELRATRDALEEVSRRYQELFEFAPDAYVVTDSDGVVLEANRAAAELLRVPAGTLARKPLASFFVADDRPALQSLVLHAGEAARVEERTLRLAPRGRDPVPAAATGTVVRDPATGAVAGVRWLLRDVTERARGEEELRRLAAELDARVADRTAQLEARTRELEARGRELAERTAEAESARTGAEEANRAKSEFLATMSHELRTPINAMVGYTQLLDMGLAGPVTDSQREYLARLGASSEHLLALVNDVLDLARVEAGRMPVAREPAVTRSAVESALALALPQAEAKGVQLTDASGDGAPYVGDENRVRQIVVNLVSNAVKFTPPGGTVAVACGTVAEAPAGARVGGGGPWAYIRVSDTGIGIAPDHRAAIFEPFTQVEGDEHGPYRRTQGGTGLGLAISRRLARLMGGDVTVESAIGHGSTFTLWLPSTGAGSDADGESASERGARALREGDGVRLHGLTQIGEQLRDQVEVVLETYAARLRLDVSLPHAPALRRSDLEDHQLCFLADLAQSLVAIEETGGLASDLLRDGSTIQRTIAELHGRTRQRQGWTEEQLRREYAILGEELEAFVRRRAGEGVGEASIAFEVIRRLLARAAASALRSLRHAAQPGAVA